jgi:hypothetical protein
MFHAKLICSDGDCAEIFEAWGTLAELESLACDCGCTLEILTLDECEDGDPRLELQLVR